MPRSLRLVVPGAALALVCALPAAADTVTLNNGDTLTGQITEQADDHVTLQHPLLGELKIPRIDVAATDPPRPIDAGGPPEADPAEADPVEAEPPAKPAPTPAQLEQAKAVLTGQGYTVEPPAEEEPPNPGLKIGPLTLLEGWERRFEIGINGSEGNTENLSARFGLDMFYEDVEKRWSIGSAYYTQRESGDTTENEFYAQATRDWLLPGKKHFYFATARYDWDEFQDWDSRVSGAGGLGYQFVKDDKWDVLGRLGGGGRYEWGGSDDGFTPEGLAGIAVGYKITPDQSIRFANTYYPDLEDINEFRNVTSLDYVIKLNAARNLALKLGAENEHQSDPGPGTEHNDLKYYLSLLWDF